MDEERSTTQAQSSLACLLLHAFVFTRLMVGSELIITMAAHHATCDNTGCCPISLHAIFKPPVSSV